MRYQKNDMRDFLLGPDMRRVCTLAAARKMAIARTLVGHESGDTARSGRLTHGRDAKGDRVRVVIEFGWTAEGSIFGAVEEQFGNKRHPASRFLTRALLAE